MPTTRLTVGDSAGLALLSSPYAWIGVVKTPEGNALHEARARGIEREIPIGKTIALTRGADGSFLAADPQNNTVHIAWCGHPYFGEAYHLYYRKRINTTWMPKEAIVASSADQYEPSMVINPLTNNPHILWRRWFSLSADQIMAHPIVQPVSASGILSPSTVATLASA